MSHDLEAELLARCRQGEAEAWDELFDLHYAAASRDPPSPLPGPDLALLNSERLSLVGQALDELGGPCQEIIQMRYFGDLSYEEIAGDLGLNPKTVSSRLSKCLDKLEAVTRA